MAAVNKVFLLGNLTRDVEMRHTPSGAGVASFGMAVNRRYKVGNESKEDNLFIDITVWGKQGENCVEHLRKGSQVMIEGRLQFRQWETDEGQKRNKVDVVADNVQFLGSPKGDKTDHPYADQDDIPF